MSTLRARRSGTVAHGSARLRVCGVALIIAALFPYVSATDDVLRIQHLNLHSDEAHQRVDKPGSPDSGDQQSSDGLIRLYETMDTPLIDAVQSVSLSFSFVSLVITPALRTCSRDITFRGGRSPPLGIA